MKKSDILNAIGQILPDINSGKETPKSAILKYASAQRLTASQVERMGQLFNHVQTINVMDKSSGENRRGSTFKLLDVENCVDDYMGMDHAPKAPAPKKMVRDGMAPAQQKAASTVQVEPAERKPRGMLHLLEEKTAAIDAAYEFQTARAELRKSIASSTRELVKLGKIRLGEALQDFGHAHPEFAQGMAAHLIKSGAEYQIVPDKRALFWDRQNTCPQFLKLAEDLLALGQLVEMEKEAFTTKPKPPPLPTTGTGLDPFFFGQPPPRGSGGGPRLNPLDLSGRGTPLTAAEKQMLSDVYWADSMRQNRWDGQDEASVLGDGAARIGDLLETGVTAASRLANSAANVPERARSMASFYMDLAGRQPEKQQEKAREAENKARAGAIMTRLLLTDPVLSKADPRQVTRLFNALAPANPEMFRNPDTAASLLREGLQYASVPLHTYGTLAKTRKDQLDAQRGAKALEKGIPPKSNER